MVFLIGENMPIIIGFACLIAGAFCHSAIIPAVYASVEFARQLLISVLV
jgi:hypothetical protein